VPHLKHVCTQKEKGKSARPRTFGRPMKHVMCATTDLFDYLKLAIVFHLAKSDIAVKYTHPFRVESSPAVCRLGTLKRSRYHDDDVEAMVRRSLVSSFRCSRRRRPTGPHSNSADNVDR